MSILTRSSLLRATSWRHRLHWNVVADIVGPTLSADGLVALAMFSTFREEHGGWCRQQLQLREIDDGAVGIDRDEVIDALESLIPYVAIGAEPLAM